MTPVDIKEFDAQLERHDWHYSFSDDITVYRAGRAVREQLEKLAQTSPNHDRLFRAYTQYNNSMPHGDQHEAQALSLRMARISTGATTQEELDLIEQDRQMRERQAADRKYQQLVAYDALCMTHDWFYWTYRYDSLEYTNGSSQRRLLLDKAPAHLKHSDSAYWRLFRAWAAYKNAPTGGGEKKRTELMLLRKELGLTV